MELAFLDKTCVGATSGLNLFLQISLDACYIECWYNSNCDYIEFNANLERCILWQGTCTEGGDLIENEVYKVIPCNLLL